MKATKSKESKSKFLDSQLLPGEQKIAAKHYFEYLDDLKRESQNKQYYLRKFIYGNHYLKFQTSIKNQPAHDQIVDKS